MSPFSSELWNGLLLIVVGALVCLDRTQMVQAMLSRPIVIGPLLGLWGDAPDAGLAIGLGFEFLYAGRLPVGSHVPPSDTLAAFGAAGILVLVPGMTQLSDAGYASALALPLAEWGRGLDVWIRKFNGRLSAQTETLLGQGRLAVAEIVPWIALLAAAMAYALTLFVFFLIATLAIVIIGPLPGWARTGLAVFAGGLPLIGLAESVASLDLPRFGTWAVVGLGIGIFLLWVAV